MEGEDLSHFINQNEKLQLKMQKVCYYFRQIISAIDYMDTMGIAHRDLKPENILITEKNEIKLVDFGLGSIYKLNNNLHIDEIKQKISQENFIEEIKQYISCLILNNSKKKTNNLISIKRF